MSGATPAPTPDDPADGKFYGDYGQATRFLRLGDEVSLDVMADNLRVHRYLTRAELIDLGDQVRACLAD